MGHCSLELHDSVCCNTGNMSILLIGNIECLLIEFYHGSQDWKIHYICGHKKRHLFSVETKGSSFLMWLEGKAERFNPTEKSNFGRGPLMSGMDLAQHLSLFSIECLRVLAPRQANSSGAETINRPRSYSFISVSCIVTCQFK